MLRRKKGNDKIKSKATAGFLGERPPKGQKGGKKPENRCFEAGYKIKK